MQPDYRELLQFVPFLSLINVNKSDEADGRAMWQHPLLVRMVEAAIIAGIVMYGTVSRLEVRLEHVETMARDVQADIKDLRREAFDAARRVNP